MYHELFVKTGSIMGDLRDTTNSDLDELEISVHEIINQTKEESKIQKERCWICNSKEECFEDNHVAGKKHDYRLNTLCIPCHRKFTEMQKTWDKRWWDDTYSESLKKAFLLMGIRDMLILKTMNTGKNIYIEYGLKFNSTISQLLKE
jgi:hypothetical protein